MLVRLAPSGPFVEVAAPGDPLGGDLSGMLPNPSVVGLTEAGGPTSLPIGAVADGELLKRVGGQIVGASPAGTSLVDAVLQGEVSPFPPSAALWYSDGATPGGLWAAYPPGATGYVTLLAGVPTFLGGPAEGLVGYSGGVPQAFGGGSNQAFIVDSLGAMAAIAPAADGEFLGRQGGALGFFVPPGGAPAGPNLAIQVNNSGAFGGSANLQWNDPIGAWFLQGPPPPATTGNFFCNFLHQVSFFSATGAAGSAFVVNGFNASQFIGNGNTANFSVSNIGLFNVNATTPGAVLGFSAFNQHNFSGDGATATWTASNVGDFTVTESGGQTCLKLNATTAASVAAGRVLSWDGTQNVYVPPPIQPPLRTADFGSIDSQQPAVNNTLARCGTVWTANGGTVSRAACRITQNASADNFFICLWEFLGPGNYALRAQTALTPCAVAQFDLPFAAPHVLTPRALYVLGVLLQGNNPWQFAHHDRGSQITAGGEPYAGGLMSVATPGVPSNGTSYNSLNHTPWIEAY